MNGKTVLIWIVVMAILIPTIVGLYKWRDIRRARWEAVWAEEATALGLGWSVTGEARAELDFPARLAMVGTYRGRGVEISQHHYGGNTEGDPGTWVTMVDVRLSSAPGADAAKPVLKTLKRKAYRPPAVSRKTLTVQRKGKHRKSGQLTSLLDQMMDAADTLEAL